MSEPMYMRGGDDGATGFSLVLHFSPETRALSIFLDERVISFGEAILSQKLF